MAKRSANPTQSIAKRLFEAAAKVGVNVRVEFHPDGMIVATTSPSPGLTDPDRAATELDGWMRKHANQT
jgi:hypothetical protein